MPWQTLSLSQPSCQPEYIHSFYNEQLTHWCRLFIFGPFYNGRRSPEFASECQVILLCSLRNLPHNSHSHSCAAMNGSANPCVTYISRQPYSHIHTAWFWFYQHCCHVHMSYIYYSNHRIRVTILTSRSDIKKPWTTGPPKHSNTTVIPILRMSDLPSLVLTT